jgi:hypothetical protein
MSFSFGFIFDHTKRVDPKSVLQAVDDAFVGNRPIMTRAILQKCIHEVQYAREYEHKQFEGFMRNVYMRVKQ